MRVSLAILSFLAAVASAYPADTKPSAAPANGRITMSPDGIPILSIPPEIKLKHAILSRSEVSALGLPPVPEMPGHLHDAIDS
ncbi:Protein of unknown function [Pyronema omphalodes CBS 100304]|uniref:Uncharacterized protein n=1 Tax=Pyronema omphalodes (strain CBS 100304) TaxID=1076935 RepID=U4L9T5_PYROM|nr:Protein of unknown function [Pyronema omphalodes CBS 100304]